MAHGEGAGVGSGLAARIHRFLDSRGVASYRGESNSEREGVNLPTLLNRTSMAEKTCQVHTNPKAELVL